MTFWDILFFRRSLFDSILELCRTRRKRLYVLGEINQIRLQMKTYFFMEKLGSRSKSWGKRLCFGRESLVFSVFLEKMKERGSMYEHFPLCGSAWAAIWGRLSTKPFSNSKLVFRKVYIFKFFWRWFQVFPKWFRWVCKDFGLEPWRKMMRRGQLSILSK